MEKQEIRTFGRRHGKKLSARKQTLLDTVLPAILPKNIKNTRFGSFFSVRKYFFEKSKKLLKKVLTNEKRSDIIDKLTSRGNFRVALAL